MYQKKKGYADSDNDMLINTHVQVGFMSAFEYLLVRENQTRAKKIGSFFLYISLLNIIASLVLMCWFKGGGMSSHSLIMGLVIFWAVFYYIHLLAMTCSFINRLSEQDMIILLGIMRQHIV